MGSRSCEQLTWIFEENLGPDRGFSTGPIEAIGRFGELTLGEAACDTCPDERRWQLFDAGRCDQPRVMERVVLSRLGLDVAERAAEGAELKLRFGSKRRSGQAVGDERSSAQVSAAPLLSSVSVVFRVVRPTFRWRLKRSRSPRTFRLIRTRLRAWGEEFQCIAR